MPDKTIELSPVKEIILNEVYNPYQMSIGNEGNLFILDQADHSVKIFTPDGELIRTAGGKGSGPGEFENPMSLGVGAGLFVVGESLGKFSVFSDDGTFLYAFQTDPPIGHLNADVRIMADSSLIIGGAGVGTTTDGSVSYKLVHTFSIDGIHRSSYFPFSEIAVTLNLGGFYGASIAIGKGDRIYTVQPMEYLIGIFTSDGVFVDKFENVPDYFRTIHEPMPQGGDISEWAGTFDTITGIFVVDDNYIAVGVRHKGENIIEILDKTYGKTTARIETHERLNYIDRDGLFYFASPLADEPVTVLEVYELSGV